MQKELNFPAKIKDYFNFLRLILDQKKTERESELIQQKIYDYIMTKIYDKIYPIEHYKDNYFFQKSILFSWTEIKQYIKLDRKLLIGDFIEDVLKNMKLIETEKSPRKKILYMNKIFDSIELLLQFNGLKNIDIDEMLNILKYPFIKSKATKIFSDLKFMELYIDEKKIKIYIK